MTWHFVVSEPRAGAYNMALDEALMGRAARTGEGVFRVYGWSAPTLSLGRNQRARGFYDPDAARRLGVEFVRRPTGGRALLHHREVTYSATLPVSGPGGARAAYDFINGVLLEALKTLGVGATRATESASMPPGLRPCFDAPSAHEIVVGGRKLVGSAQWRHDGALLQHGSILVRDDQQLVARLLNGNSEIGTPAAATLADSLGREPSLGEVAAVLRGALGAAVTVRAGAFPPDEVLALEVDRLHVIYGGDEWTWRR